MSLCLSGSAFFIHADVSIASEAENLIKVTNDKFGIIDVVLNNASLPHKPTSIENLTESLWDRVYAVNVKSIFFIAKYAVPLMKKNGGGVIINRASMAGVRPRENSSAYSSSKAAAIQLTKSLALDLAQYNIRVNVINPSAVDSPGLLKVIADDADVAEAKKVLTESLPLKCMPTPEDVAYAALYLASDEAKMLTGICINVDAGRGI